MRLSVPVLALLGLLVTLTHGCTRGAYGTRACVDQLYQGTPYATEAIPAAPHYFSFDHDNACADFHVTVEPISGDPKLVVSPPRYSPQDVHSYTNFVSDVRGVSGDEEVTVRAIDRNLELGAWNMAVHCDEPFCSGVTQFTITAWEDVVGNDTYIASGTLAADERVVVPVCQPHTCGTMTIGIRTTAGDDIAMHLARDYLDDTTDLSEVATTRLIGEDEWEIELRPDGGWLPSLLYLAVDCDSNRGCGGGSYEVTYVSESGRCPPSIGDPQTQDPETTIFGETFWSAAIVAVAVVIAGVMIRSAMPKTAPAQRIPDDSGSERDSKDGPRAIPAAEGAEEKAADAAGDDIAPPTPRPPSNAGTPRDATV